MLDPSSGALIWPGKSQKLESHTHTTLSPSKVLGTQSVAKADHHEKERMNNSVNKVTDVSGMLY